MLKKILPIVAGILLTSVAWAQDLLRDDHPDRYVVVKGDTLWDISARFLRDPWLWPEVWQVNPQINNPHLIYPGDIINLVYIDGQPRLQLSRERKLSPAIRRIPGDHIKPIDLEQIRPFLDKRTILSDEEIAGLPYVVAIQDGNLAGTQGQLVYVRDLDAQLGDTFAVVRPTVRFEEVPATFPWGRATEFEPRGEEWNYPTEYTISDYAQRFWTHYVNRSKQEHTRVLGHEVIEAATAEVVGGNEDVITLRLTTSSIEVSEGDLVIPKFDAQFDSRYYPRGIEVVPPNTRVIGMASSLFYSGRNQVIAINRGSADGIENGHVMASLRPGREDVHDRVRYPDGNLKSYFTREGRRTSKVDLPDEYTGHVMVFKTFENVSYAIIVRSEKATRLLDKLVEP